MFDVNDRDSTRVTPYRTDEGDSTPGETAALAASIKPKSNLDDEKACELQARLIAFYRQELSRQERNRAEMAVDEDYYDNIQCT